MTGPIRPDRSVHGFYSEKLEEMDRSDFLEPQFTFVGPNGERVNCWCRTREWGEENFRWPDAVYVGCFPDKWATFRMEQVNPRITQFVEWY